MPAKRDPIAAIPEAAAIREALGKAKNRVSALEFLLEVAEGVEQRLNGEVDRPVQQTREAARCA